MCDKCWWNFGSEYTFLTWVPTLSLGYPCNQWKHSHCPLQGDTVTSRLPWVWQIVDKDHVLILTELLSKSHFQVKSSLSTTYLAPNLLAIIFNINLHLQQFARSLRLKFWPFHTSFLLYRHSYWFPILFTCSFLEPRNGEMKIKLIFEANF